MNIIMGAPKGATGEMGGERWRERCGICKARRSLHLSCTHPKAKDKRPARRSRVDSRGRKSWCALVLFRVTVHPAPCAPIACGLSCSYRLVCGSTTVA